MLTVPRLFRIKAAIGFPTILLLPTTTTSFPSKSILYFSIKAIIPAGVDGDVKPSLFWNNKPKFSALKPSTSLISFILFKTFVAFIWGGSGKFIIIPSTSVSLFNLSIKFKR